MTGSRAHERVESLNRRPPSNREIADIFQEVADLLAIGEENPFRVRAYENAARTVRGMGRELSDLVSEEADLTRLPNIGKDLAAQIREDRKSVV